MGHVYQIDRQVLFYTSRESFRALKLVNFILIE